MEIPNEVAWLIQLLINCAILILLVLLIKEHRAERIKLEDEIDQLRRQAQWKSER